MVAPTVKTTLSQAQLVPPQPCPQRGRPFQLSVNAAWLVYPHGKVVYLRAIKGLQCKEYREHAHPVQVARLSPDGQWIASGDAQGTVRVWSVGELKTRLECSVLGGAIMDLSWDPTGRHVVVVGDGRERFGHALVVEGGSSLGEIVGPSRTCCTVSVSSSRCVIGSDDHSVTLFSAQPSYKFVRTIRDHGGFVQTTRFNPAGDVFVSGGGDGCVFLYQAEDGARIGGGKWHEAGVLAVEWIDNERLVTASADRTVRLWRVERNGNEPQCVRVLCRDEEETSHQKQRVAIAISNDTLLVLNLDGTIESLSMGDAPPRDSPRDSPRDFSLVATGHVKGVTDVCVDAGGTQLHSASYDGRIVTWALGEDGCVAGAVRHTEAGAEMPISRLHWRDGGVVGLAAGRRFERGVASSLISSAAPVVASHVTMDGQLLLLTEDGTLHDTLPETLPETLPDHENRAAGTDSLRVPIERGKIQCAAFVETSNMRVLFATCDGHKGLSLWEVDAKRREIRAVQQIEEASLGVATSVAFNPQGTSLAIGDDQRRIRLFVASATGEWTRVKTQWCHHAARIDSLVWSADGRLLLSAGVDGHLLLWSWEASPNGPVATVKNAHSSPITAVRRLGTDAFVSVGSDACIRIWRLHP